MGEALVVPSEGPASSGTTGLEVLKPVSGSELPTASNMEAAERFFAAAMHHAVPLIILSKHVVHACRIPSQLLDALASHGGVLGSQLSALEHSRITELWRLCRLKDQPAVRGVMPVIARRGLPVSCDEAWFLKTFCAGCAPIKVDNGQYVPPEIKDFVVFSPLALLAALPCVAERFLDATVVEVRSAKHSIVGRSAEQPGIEDVHAVRELIFQCLFKGVRLNSSEYDLTMPEPIPLSCSGEAGKVAVQEAANGTSNSNASASKVWRYDASEKCLSWLRPPEEMRGCLLRHTATSRSRKTRASAVEAYHMRGIPHEKEGGTCLFCCR
jgi:hypothetical protein